MFISVSIESLKDSSKAILLKLNNDARVKKDNINIITVKKYLFISLESKFIFVNINLFINIFFGLLKERIWLIEYLNKEYIFINLRPELVEKKDPPMITRIKKTKFKLGWFTLSEKPIFETLLEIAKKLLENSLLKLKKRKKIEIITIK